MDKTLKLGLLGAVTLMAAAPMGAQAASPDAQALARSRGVQLIDARWYHHRHYYGYGYAYAPYWTGYYYPHRYWRHHHRRWW